LSGCGKVFLMIKVRSIRAGRLFFVCSLALALALALTGGTHGQENKILVRGDRDYPPYEFLDHKGNPTGFNIELIRAVAGVMGLDLEIQLGPWNEVRNQLETGQIDVLAGMYHSEQRSRLVSFSIPHIIVTHTLIVRKDSSIQSLDELDGKEILVQEGDIMHDFLKEENLSVKIVPVQNQTEALKALGAGNYDGALVPKLQGLYIIHELGLYNLESRGPSILPRKYCFAVKKGDDVLLAKLNEGLNILNIKGKYGEIHNRWFGINDEAPVLQKMRWYIGWILIALLGLLILTFIWSWTLRKKVNEKTDDLVRELGERKRVEDELLITNTVLKTQQEASIDGIVVVDNEGRIVSFNQRFIDMWGVPPEAIKAQMNDSMLGHAMGKVIEPQAFLDRVKFLYEHPEEKSWDEITLIDGTTFERYSAPMRLAKDKYYGRVWYFRDITARKRSEEALFESERRYRSLFEAANDAILLIEGDRFVDCNARALEMFGCRRDQLINETPVHFSPFLQPDSQNSDIKANAMITAAYNSGAPQFFEWKHRRLNGELFDTEVSLSLAPIQGKPHLLVIIRDITHRKEAEREKENLIKQLQQAQKMEAIGTLAGGIAHDFNNILAAIIGYTELTLLDMPADSKQYHNLTQSLKASKRARDLVKQILSFSRQERRQAKPVRLEPIVTEALDMIRAMIPSTIEIREDLHSEAKVLVDPTSAHQVLMNLCANAAHAMRERGGLLEVRLMDVKIDAAHAKRFSDLREGEYVKLTVKDTGDGIPPHVIERIFDPFFTTKGRGEGTGMGLSVAHGVMKSCGGCILVSSEPGQGSMFEVFFPVMGMNTIGVTSAGSQTLGGAERILVIGDNGDKSGKLSEDLLIPLGYQVTVLNSLEEALELFREKRDSFELIITDLSSLKTDGLAVAQKLGDEQPEIPVILCAGFSANLDKRMIDASGGRAIIRKPIIKQELASTIRKLLDRGAVSG